VATSRIKVMADYFAWPLWVDGPGGGMLAPDALPLPNDLRDELGRWGRDYTEVLRKNDVLPAGCYGAVLWAS
jgi:hypothetical protein